LPIALFTHHSLVFYLFIPPLSTLFLTGISAPLLTSYASMREKQDKGQHLEIVFSLETGVVLLEALTLLHQVSHELTCQRCLIRSKWIAVLVDLSFFCPVHCRQKALMLLSDLLPLSSIEVRLEIKGDDTLSDERTLH
jgi:hypothetical protein